MIILNFPFKLISKDNEKIYNRQGKFFLSSKFKQFAKVVEFEAQCQYKQKPLERDLSVTINAWFNDKRHADCYNLPKGICDALNKIVWNDDRQIKKGSIIIFEGKEFKPKFEILIDTL